MKNNLIIVTLCGLPDGQTADLEVSPDISADDLLQILARIFYPGTGIQDTPLRFLKAEYPRAVIQGSASLRELGLRTGSRLFVPEGSGA